MCWIDSVVLETVVIFLEDLLKRGAQTSCLANADAVVARGRWKQGKGG